MKKEWLTPEGAFKRLEAVKQAELSETDLLAYKDAEVEYLESKLKTAEEKGESNAEEITAMKKEISEVINVKYKTLLEAVHAQGKAIGKNIMTVKEVEGATSDIIEGFKAKSKDLEKLKTSNGSVQIEIKTDVTTSSVQNSTLSRRVDGIGQQPVRRTMMRERFRNGGTLGVNSGGTVTWVDQDTKNRASTNVAECDAFPESEITWIERELKAKKIGDSIPVCIEALEDFAFIRSEIENFLMENILLREDEQYLNGDGTGENITGVDAVAQAWSVATGSPIEEMANAVETPTIANVLFTAISQIKNSGENNTFMPDYIDLSPVDFQLMLLEKDANKNSLNDRLVRISDDGRVFIAGVEVIENPLVLQDTAFVGDYTKGTIFNHRGLNLMIATQHASDFVEDRIRLKGSMRKVLMIRNVHANAFLKIPSISAAITALTK